MHGYPQIRTDAPREVKHLRCAARSLTVVLALLIMLTAIGCEDSEAVKSRRNVRPPQPGAPAGPADVQGIYRTIHQAVLQLRANGSMVFIVPEGPGPTSGTYTLVNGIMTIRTDVCGTAVGEYRVQVTGPPEPGEAALNFTAVQDDCDSRRRYLTIDPFVYSNS